MSALAIVVPFVAVCAVHTSFGIAGLVIADRDSDAAGECGPAVWYALLFLSIWQILASLGSICLFVCNFVDSTNKNNNNNNLMLSILSALYVWACVAYFEVSDACASYYDNEYPDLRKMLFADVILFFVELSLGVIIFCFMCFSIACGVVEDPPRVTAA